MNYNSYTYVTNNPLKYTDPSGYLYYRYERIQWEEGVSKSSGGGEGSHFNTGIPQSGFYIDGGGQCYVDGEPVPWSYAAEVYGEEVYSAPRDENGEYINVKVDPETRAWYYWEEGQYSGKKNYSGSVKFENGGTYTMDWKDFGVYRKKVYIDLNQDGWLSELWNSPIARALIPDRISISLEGNVAVALGAGQDIEANFILRGRDARIKPYITNTLSRRVGFHGDAGFQINSYWYIGPSENIYSSFINGFTYDIDISAGFYGINLMIGTNEHGDPIWYGHGTGLGGGLFVSGGKGHTSPGLNSHPLF